MKLYSIIAIVLAGLIGCNDQAKIDQSNMCIYSSDKEAKSCKDGQMSFFRPSSWGNEQLPLDVTAAYCDFNYPVVYTNAGVVCVFTTKRMPLLGK